MHLLMLVIDVGGCRMENQPIVRANFIILVQSSVTHQPKQEKL